MRMSISQSVDVQSDAGLVAANAISPAYYRCFYQHLHNIGLASVVFRERGREKAKNGKYSDIHPKRGGVLHKEKLHQE